MESELVEGPPLRGAAGGGSEARGRFIPFFSKYEFEALLLADPSIVAEILGDRGKATLISRWLEACGSPEEINGECKFRSRNF